METTQETFEKLRAARADFEEDYEVKSITLDFSSQCRVQENLSPQATLANLRP